MKITFDTNTLDKAARPARFPKDPDQAKYFKVNAALAAGKLAGHFSETLITLEGIQKIDRAPVFDSTQLHQEPENETISGGVTTIEMRSVVEQPKRKPLHPEHKARITAAVDIGMKALRAPRTGMLLLADPDGKYFVTEAEEERAKRISIFQQVAQEIEIRGAGIAVAKALSATFSSRDKVNEPWFNSLVRARDVHEENAVKRAIAEWADADSIAAHAGYGIDLFCSGDEGKSAGAASVLNVTNRSWLRATYGVKFVTISELSEML